MQSLDEVMQRYQDYSKQSQAPLPPPALSTRAAPPGIPQYTIPNAFQTPPGSVAMYSPSSSQNSYDAQVATRFQSQIAMYSDPNSAAGNMRARQGRNWGERAGGAFGAGVGAIASTAMGMGPAPGAMLGDVAGQFGGSIGETLGRPLGAFGDLVTGNLFSRQRQAQHMNMTTGVQQATYGNVMMGAGQVGLGGQGMNLQSASKLAQRITATGQQQNMSKDDMLNITRAAGEMNFLDQSSNVDQIADTIKKLTKVVGLMGKITGDPDIIRNLKEIANLRAVGLNLNQAVQGAEQIDMTARAMGVSRYQAMAGAGAAGASLFQQAGMTRGVGMIQGTGAAALARMGMGGLTAQQLELAGGQEGLASTFMQQSAQFAQGPGNLMMLSGLTRGGGGQFGLAGGFGQGLMGGGSFQSRLQEGLGNIRSPGDIVQFMGQQRELQSQMMEQLGPFGAQLAQGQNIQELAKMMPGANQREKLLMAASTVTGSAEKGLELMRTIGSKDFRERAGGFFEEEQRRAKYSGAVEGAQERKDRAHARQQRFRKKHTAGMARALGKGSNALQWAMEATGYLDDSPESQGSVAELDEAVNQEQEEQDRIADQQFEEETGLERTTKRAREYSLSKPTDMERKRVKKMMEAGWKVANLSRGGQEVGGIGTTFEFDEDTKSIKIVPGKHIKLKGGFFGLQQEVVTPELTDVEKRAADMFQGSAALAGTGGTPIGGALEKLVNIGDRLGIGLMSETKKTIQKQRQEVLKKVENTGRHIRETKKRSQADWDKTMSKTIENLGAATVVHFQDAAIKYAASLAGSDKGVDADQLYKEMVKSYAKEKNISYEKADELLSPQKDAIIQTGLQLIKEGSNDDAKEAVTRSEIAAGMIDTEGMSKEALETFRKEAAGKELEAMKELGFAHAGAQSMGDVSQEQKDAFETFRGMSSEDQAMAMGMAQGTDASESVRKELMDLKKSDPKRYRRVKDKVDAMKGGLSDKDKKALTSGGAAATKGGIKALGGALEEGFMKGKGEYKGLHGAAERVVIEEEMKKRGISDVSEEGEGAGLSTEESRKKTQSLKQQQKQLEDLSKTFGEFPGAVTEFKQASADLKRAVEGITRKTSIPNPLNFYGLFGG